VSEVEDDAIEVVGSDGGAERVAESQVAANVSNTVQAKARRVRISKGLPAL
jgi:hypothetical protein